MKTIEYDSNAVEKLSKFSTVYSSQNLMTTDTASIVMLIFSSSEPLGSQEELIVYPSSRCPSGVRPSGVVHYFQRSSNRFANQSQILCGASLGR